MQFTVGQVVVRSAEQRVRMRAKGARRATVEQRGTVLAINAARCEVRVRWDSGKVLTSSMSMISAA